MAAVRHIPNVTVTYRLTRQIDHLKNIVSGAEIVGIIESLVAVDSTAFGLLDDPLLDPGAVPNDRFYLVIKQKPDSDCGSQGEAGREQVDQESVEREFDRSHGGAQVISSSEELVPNSCDVDDRRVEAADRGEQHEESEVCVVAVPAAVVDPRAVVVHFQDAPLTDATVVCSGRLVALTYLTELQILTVACFVRLPLLRDVTWSDEDSAKEISKYQNQPQHQKANIQLA